jgi:hypothetical protein
MYTRRRVSSPRWIGPEHDQAVGDVDGQAGLAVPEFSLRDAMHRYLGEIDLTLGVLTGRAGCGAATRGTTTSELVEVSD